MFTMEQVESRVMQLLKTGLINFIFQEMVTDHRVSGPAPTAPISFPIHCYLPPNEAASYLMDRIDQAEAKVKALKDKLLWETTNVNLYEALKAKVEYYKQVQLNEQAFG